MERNNFVKIVFQLIFTCIYIYIYISEGGAFFVSSPVVGSHSAGRACPGTDLVGCVSALEIFLRPQKAVSPGFYPLRGGWIHCLAPEAPLIRRIPTKPKVFLAMLDACELRPCDRTHLKNGQVPDLYARVAYDRY